MSKASIVKNIFLGFNRKTAEKYLSYFWMNGKPGPKGTLELPPGSVNHIQAITKKTGFSPAVLKRMAQERLLISRSADVKTGTAAHTIMNKDWSPALPQGWSRQKKVNWHATKDAPPGLGKNELLELRNHHIQPNKAHPTWNDFDAELAARRKKEKFFK